VCAGEADRAARARVAVTVRAAALPGVAARFADRLARGGGVVVMARIDRPICGRIRRRRCVWGAARRAVTRGHDCHHHCEDRPHATLISPRSRACNGSLTRSHRRLEP
jgi:hypothetical protein